MGDRALTRAPTRSLLVVAAVVLAACGVDDPRDPAGGAEPASATTFAVEWVPEGLELIAAGEGERTRDLGIRATSTDDPNSPAARSSGFPQPFYLVVTQLPGASFRVTNRNGPTTARMWR